MLTPERIKKIHQIKEAATPVYKNGDYFIYLDPFEAKEKIEEILLDQLYEDCCELFNKILNSSEAT